jgi:uncharacterized protein
MANEEDRSNSLNQKRRNFLKASSAIGAGLLAQAAIPASASAAAATPAEAPAKVAMPTRNLGKTGHKVGIFSLGGQGVLERDGQDAVAIPVIERALDLGVNYLDTSSIYGGPSRCSERYLGQVMKRRRAEAFLASKTIRRTRDESLRMLETSLKLLNTDHLDLWQLHDIGTVGDVDKCFAKGGAMEALLEAKEQKMVRFLGITGHHRPDCLMEGIRRYPFDTVLMALSAADKFHFSFVEQLLPMAMEKQIGIIAMKVVGRGRILSKWTPPSLEQQKHMWEGVVPAPNSGTLTVQEALYYVFSLPISTAIIGCDTVEQVEENVQLARSFTPLSEAQMAAIAAKSEPVSKPAMFYKFLQRA